VAGVLLAGLAAWFGVAGRPVPWWAAVLVCFAGAGLAAGFRWAVAERDQALLVVRAAAAPPLEDPRL
jgi:hypothetical protein